MGLSNLPVFQFLDKSLMTLQTQWASILNPIIQTVNGFNSLTPTMQSFGVGSGLYTTPSNAFYLNIRMSATSGQTVFGSSYLIATSTGVTVPNSSNIKSYFFRSQNYLDIILSNPQSSYPYSVASSGYIVVKEFYQ